MIVVREVFIAKPGMASKLARMFKEEMAEWGEIGAQEYMSQPQPQPQALVYDRALMAAGAGGDDGRRGHAGHVRKTH